MQEKFKTGRREFLMRSAGGVVSVSTLSLLAAHSAWAGRRDDDDHEEHGRRRGRRGDYGPLARTPDQNGEEILARFSADGASCS